MEKISIPDGVTSIGDCVFQACSNLTNVVIPEGVISIGGWTFSGCINLKNVTIPKSVASIGERAFGYIHNFEEEKISDIVIRGYSGTAAEKYAKENEFTFKINASSDNKLTYTSSNSKIVTVNKNTGQVTIKGTDIAAITIKSGKVSMKVSVKVSPKKQSLKSVKVSKNRKLIVKWAKDKKASGYQVQISTSSNFKEIVKQAKLSKNTYTFKKLKAGKKYYVRVRSYKKSGKEMLYGTWSNKKHSSKMQK